MKNIIDSIRLQINERLNSPLFGSFVLAWACWNHRFLFVLFSSLSVDEKFEFIDKKIFPTKWDIWGNGVIKPAFTAILFIYLYPIVSKHFYGYWLKRQLEQKELRDKIEDATLLTREESHALRMEMIKRGAEYEETIKRLSQDNEVLRKSPGGPDLLEEERKRVIKNQPRLEEAIKRQSDEITGLKARLNEILTQRVDVSKTDQKAETTMEKGVLVLIEILAKNGGKLAKDNIVQYFHNQFKDSEVRVQFYLDEAIRLNYIGGNWQSRQGVNMYFYSLTESGRRFAVQQHFA